MFFAFRMVTNQTDVNGHEEHEYESLYDPDQQFHHVKRERNDKSKADLVTKNEHFVEQAFPSEYVSEQPEGERYGPEHY